MKRSSPTRKLAQAPLRTTSKRRRCGHAGRLEKAGKVALFSRAWPQFVQSRGHTTRSVAVDTRLEIVFDVRLDHSTRMCRAISRPTSHAVTKIEEAMKKGETVELAGKAGARIVSCGADPWHSLTTDRQDRSVAFQNRQRLSQTRTGDASENLWRSRTMGRGSRRANWKKLDSDRLRPRA